MAEHPRDAQKRDEVMKTFAACKAALKILGKNNIFFSKFTVL
jgi:hypothetical protein